MLIDDRYEPPKTAFTRNRLLDTVLVGGYTESSYVRIIKNGRDEFWIATASKYHNDYLNGEVVDQGNWMTADDVRDLITVLEYALSLEAPDAKLSKENLT